MTDIVERLRNRAFTVATASGTYANGKSATLCKEAADEIERLRERIAVLETAEFADEAVAAETERCAKVADDYICITDGLPEDRRAYVKDAISLMKRRIATAIRAPHD